MEPSAHPCALTSSATYANVDRLPPLTMTSPQHHSEALRKRIASRLRTSRYYAELRRARDAVAPLLFWPGSLWAFFRWTTADQRRRAFYGQFVFPGELVFDVGANVGNRSKIFLSLDARVVAFEPQPRCARLLRAVALVHPGLNVSTMALGAEVGEGDMLIFREHVLSSLSEEWAAATKASGRFLRAKSIRRWGVQIDTLDRMIEIYGTPVFIKIDVEGFEEQVIRGLSVAVRCVSLEFASESLSAVERCIARLSGMQRIEGQISIGESMEWALPAWTPPEGVVAALYELKRQDPLAWGDVYLRSATAGVP